MSKEQNVDTSDNYIGLIVILGSTIFVGVILAVLIKVFNLHEHTRIILLWVDSVGIWGPILFILLNMLIVIFLFPGVLVTMGAGFIFGVVKGSIFVVIATTLGAIIAFTLARYVLSERVAHFLMSHKKAQFLNNYLSQEGWKFIFYTRLIPFFPFKLSNYLFGLTKFNLRHFTIGTFLGIWPNTIFNVYIGSLASTLTNIGSLEDTNNLQFYFYIIGFIIAIIAVFYITKKANAAMKQYQITTSENN